MRKLWRNWSAIGLLSLSLGLGFAETQSDLKDLPPGHWAREAVEFLVSRGYLLGYPDGTFRGDQPVTRYELAVALYRLVVTQPNILWDEGAMAWLKPLVKELLVELKEVDAKESSAESEEGVPTLSQYEAKLFFLEEKVAKLMEGLDKERSLPFADLVLQMAMLRDRLEFLESGDLPPGLRSKLLSFIQEAYAERLTFLERRLISLEAQVASLGKAIEGERERRQKEVGELKKDLERTREDLGKKVQEVAQSRTETHIFSYSAYLQGTPAYGKSYAPGLYSLTGTFTYDPVKEEGYETLGGLAPGYTLLGFGYARGTEKEGFGVRGFFSLGGAFGFSAQAWKVEDTFNLKGQLALRSYTMPDLVFPEYTGLRLEASGEGLGTRFSLSGHYALTPPSGGPAWVVSGVADPCVRTAAGARVSLDIPFTNFVFLGKGSYGQENGVQPSCAISSLNYLTYEAGVGHDPTSPQAIVPNLGLYLVYGGHSSNLNGFPFGLSYLEGRGSYAFESGALRAMLGGFYRSFTPSGNHALPSSKLPLGIYPDGPGSMYGGDLLLRLGNEGFSLQVEAGLRLGQSGSTRGFTWTALPSLSFGGKDFNLKLAYHQAYGYNWDLDLPNPLGAYGVREKRAFSVQGSFHDLKFLGEYDLRGFGRLEAAYRFSW